MGHSLAGRLVVGLEGPQLSSGEYAWLAHYQPAGVILFSRNCHSFEQLSALCSTLRELVPDLEIMADHEGGAVSQLARAVGRPPAAYGLGVLDDLSLTAAVHRETGRRLRAVGVTRVLAPVVDVLTEPRNPVIGARSFGALAPLVERHAVAAVIGLLDAGLRVCLKHWPGHGGSLADTHLACGSVDFGAFPAIFAAGVAAGADAVMVGHLTARPETGLPATLDGGFLADSAAGLHTPGTDAPRLIADDITMGGLRQAMAGLGVAVDDEPGVGMLDPQEMPLAWLETMADAGCDQLLVRGIPFGALPAPETKAWASDASVSEATRPPPEFSAAAYTAARQRSWALAGQGFAAPQERLLWWDLTVGDRWQVAGGDLGSAQDQLSPRLEGHFRRVELWTENGPPREPATRLLVSSHRPLPELGPRDVRLAAEGVCLGMGHPSLVDGLARYLGPGWRVGMVYDVAPEELFPAN